MTSFFSIAYCPVRPAQDERLSVALFMSDGNKFYFRYSKSKLDALNGLIPKEAHQLLKSNLKSLNEFNHERNANEMLLHTDSRLLSESYFSYLSKYSNNLLSFSPPQPIDLNLSVENFDKLFSRFVHVEENIILPPELDIVIRVRNRIDPKIRSSVSLDAILTSKEIESLEIPAHVWFIGQNQVDVTGETINFEKRDHDLRSDLYEYLYLIDRLSHSGHKGGMHYLIGREPRDRNSTQHKLWQEIRSSHILKYVDESEADAISDYVKEHNVRPFQLV